MWCPGSTFKPMLDLDRQGKVKDTLSNIATIIRFDENLQPIVFNQLKNALDVIGELPWVQVKKGWGDADIACAKLYFERVYGIWSPTKFKDYGFIEKFIEELGTKYHIKEIAFDRWGATQMVQDLEGMGFTVVPFGQGYKYMSPPTKELMKLTLEERIAHSGHKVLRWMMDNVYVRQDPAGNIKMDKEKSTEKIDAAVATVMALDRAIRNQGSEGSVYDGRGILVF